MKFFLFTFSVYFMLNLGLAAPLDGRDDPPNPDDDGVS